MRWRLMCAALLGTALCPADMDDDLEAGEVLAAFDAMNETGRYVDDTFDQDAQRNVHGPVSFGPGRSGEAGDRAAVFPVSEEAEVYVYYGPHVGLRSQLAFDFRLPGDPGRERPWTLVHFGTAGNTSVHLSVGLDGVLHATFNTRRGAVPLFTDPLSFDEWHPVRLLYGPEGSVLLVDGAIHDFSFDWSVPWSYGESSAMYLGDRPYWSAARGEGYFAEGDHFTGAIDNLVFTRLEPGGEAQ